MNNTTPRRLSLSRLVIGMTAPAFTTRDAFGQPVQLNKEQDQKVLLSFYRYASCPLCNLRLHELLKHHTDWQAKGLRMIAVFESSPEHIHRYLDRHSAPFPIVPDPDQHLYRDYHVRPSWAAFTRAWILHFPMALRAVIGKGFLPGVMDGDWSMVPADFLIGPGLHIADAFYGQHIGDHIPLERIEKFLDASPPSA